MSCQRSSLLPSSPQHNRSFQGCRRGRQTGAISKSRPRIPHGALQAFADVDPVRLAASAARALTIGVGDITAPLLGTLAWLAGLLVVFVALAVRAPAGR